MEVRKGGAEVVNDQERKVMLWEGVGKGDRGWVGRGRVEGFKVGRGMGVNGRGFGCEKVCTCCLSLTVMNRIARI